MIWLNWARAESPSLANYENQVEYTFSSLNDPCPR